LMIFEGADQLVGVGVGRRRAAAGPLAVDDGTQVPEEAIGRPLRLVLVQLGLPLLGCVFGHRRGRGRLLLDLVEKPHRRGLLSASPRTRPRRSIAGRSRALCRRDHLPTRAATLAARPAGTGAGTMPANSLPARHRPLQLPGTKPSNSVPLRHHACQLGGGRAPPRWAQASPPGVGVGAVVVVDFDSGAEVGVDEEAAAGAVVGVGDDPADPVADAAPVLGSLLGSFPPALDDVPDVVLGAVVDEPDDDDALDPPDAPEWELPVPELPEPEDLGVVVVVVDPPMALPRAAAAADSSVCSLAMSCW